jgi:hypothetical protein
MIELIYDKNQININSKRAIQFNLIFAWTWRMRKKSNRNRNEMRKTKIMVAGDFLINVVIVQRNNMKMLWQ